jgi:MFS family permease
MSTETWTILRYRDFAVVCGARFAVTLAMHMQNVAIGWYVYDVTRNPFALGFLGLAGFIPTVALMLVTGHVADRVDRRLILICSSIAMAATALALLVLVWAGAGTVWPVYFILVFFAAARSFFNPSSQAMVPNLVPPAELPSAIAFSSGTFQAAVIGGPALGGLLYAVDPRLPFGMSLIFNVVAALSAVAIRHRSAATPKQPATWRTLIAGFEFALARPVVLGAISLDMFAVLFGGVVALLPIYAKDVLEVGPWGLGLLRSAPAIGAVAMATALASTALIKRQAGTRLFVGVAAYGLATAIFGLSTSFILSLVCLTIVGAADMVSVVIRHTMVQAETPDDLRGRVAAVNTLFISTASELGQLRAGVLAGFLGAVPAVVIGGVGAVLIALLWSQLFPSLRDRDHLVAESEPARA